MGDAQKPDGMMRQMRGPWGPVRWIRLALAGTLLMAGIYSGDAVAYALAAFLGLQAVLNFGCCESACGTSLPGADVANEGDVAYEEVGDPARHPEQRP